MSLQKALGAPIRYKLWRAMHLRLIAGDLAGPSREAECDDATHLQSAINWLCRAQDVRNGKGDAGGVSAGWSFEDGWLPSYPETSGYIIETFLAASAVMGLPDLVERAGRIIDWELSIQNEDGSFPGHFGEPGSRPVVFNTGQIMHGMLAGYVELGRAECLEAAIRAGYWLLQRQDADGCWRRNVHNCVPHTYNTRSAWALLRAGLLAGEPKLARAAERNLGWALAQQTESGWFAMNAFTPDKAPFTHTIAYAIRGILESGLLLESERLVSAASRAALALAERQRADGWLAGVYDDGWMPNASYCCLTGLAQMTVIWGRLAQHRGTSVLLEPIRRALTYVKKNHKMIGDGSPQDGGIAGSVPIWGRYSMFEFPNWAAKFFADALMMQISATAIPAEMVAACSRVRDGV